MATGATDPGLGMWRALEVGVRARVASQAGRIDRLGQNLAELQDLGFVPAGIHVRLPWTVAALAGKTSSPLRQSQGGMGIMRKFGGLVAVA
jgi:hypothetical protein